MQCPRETPGILYILANMAVQTGGGGGNGARTFWPRTFRPGHFGLFRGRNVHGRNVLGRNVCGRNVLHLGKTAMVLLAGCPCRLRVISGRKVKVPAVTRGWGVVVTNDWCIRMRITTVKGSFGEVYRPT